MDVELEELEALALLEAEEAMVASSSSQASLQSSRVVSNRINIDAPAPMGAKRAAARGLRTCSRCSYNQLTFEHTTCPVCGLSVTSRARQTVGAASASPGAATALAPSAPPSHAPDTSARFAAAQATTRSYEASSLMRRGAGKAAGIAQIAGQSRLGSASGASAEPAAATSRAVAAMGEFRRRPSSPSSRSPQAQRTLGQGGFTARAGALVLAPAACRTLAGVTAERLQAAAGANSLVPIDASTASTWQFPLHPAYPERKYQLDIARTALFQNTLVSLPTGLGKTFIAAVVMHNYRRWYPGGKIVFMAPTRPLVAQQVEACHKVVGIPESDTAQMLGAVAAKHRAAMWAERNVVYCTPHMFENDLRAGRVNARDVVLVVLDEAHRATGNYAYCKVIRQLDESHSRYRLLALSATPGTDLKRVQSVIDVLHVGAVEARADGDPDVAKFTHSRTIDRITVSLSSALKHFQDTFAAALKPLVERLHRAKLLSTRDPRRLSTMALLKGSSELRADPSKFSIPPDDVPRLIGVFGALQQLQPAMTELQMHGTFAFWRSLQTFARQSHGTMAQRAVMQSGPWQVLVRELSAMEATGRHVLHPKLVKLGERLLDHFARHSRAAAAASSASSPAGEGSGGSAATRVIIFTETRNSVAEIIKYIRTTPSLTGICTAAAFVGQSGSKKAPPASGASSGSSSSALTGAPSAAGGRLVSSQELAAAQGQTQKQQADVVAKFRTGEYNTLVATCIGEEGLDIGEVGLIVLFDSSGSPVRTVQRIGRTGRQRSGEIVALITPGQETAKFDQAFRKYRSVSTALRSNLSRFRLSDRVSIMSLPHAVLERRQLSSGESMRLSQVAGTAAPAGAAPSAGTKDIREAMAAGMARPVGVSDSQAALVRQAFDPCDADVQEVADRSEAHGLSRNSCWAEEADDDGIVDLLDDEEDDQLPGGEASASSQPPQQLPARGVALARSLMDGAASRPRSLPAMLSRMVSRGAELAANTGQLPGLGAMTSSSSSSCASGRSALGSVLEAVLRAGRGDDWASRAVLEEAAATITQASKPCGLRSGRASGGVQASAARASASTGSNASSAMRPAADLDPLSSDDEDGDFEQPNAAHRASSRSHRGSIDVPAAPAPDQLGDHSSGGGVLGRIYREEQQHDDTMDSRVSGAAPGAKPGDHQGPPVGGASDPLAALGASRIRPAGQSSSSSAGAGTRWARREAAEALSTSRDMHGPASASGEVDYADCDGEEDQDEDCSFGGDPAFADIPLVTPSQRARKRKSPPSHKSTAPSSSVASAGGASNNLPALASTAASSLSRHSGKPPAEPGEPVSAHGHERRWTMLAAAGTAGSALLTSAASAPPARTVAISGAATGESRAGGVQQPSIQGSRARKLVIEPGESDDEAVLVESPIAEAANEAVLANTPMAQQSPGGAAVPSLAAGPDDATTSATVTRRGRFAADSDDDSDAVSPARRARRRPIALSKKSGGSDSEAAEGALAGAATGASPDSSSTSSSSSSSSCERDDVIIPVTGLPQRPPKEIARFLEEAADHSGPDDDADSANGDENGVDGFEASFIDDRIMSQVSERSWTDDEQRQRVRRSGKHSKSGRREKGSRRSGPVVDAAGAGADAGEEVEEEEEDAGALSLHRQWEPNQERMPFVAALLAEAEAAGVAPKRGKRRRPAAPRRRKANSDSDDADDDGADDDEFPSSRRGNEKRGGRLRPMPLTGAVAHSDDGDDASSPRGSSSKRGRVARRGDGLTLQERARRELEELEAPSDENEEQRLTPVPRSRRRRGRTRNSASSARVQLSGHFAGGYASGSQDSFIVDDLAVSLSSRQSEKHAGQREAPLRDGTPPSASGSSAASAISTTPGLPPLRAIVSPVAQLQLARVTAQPALSESAAKARSARNRKLALQRKHDREQHQQLAPRGPNEALMPAPSKPARVPVPAVVGGAGKAASSSSSSSHSRAVEMRVSLFSKLALFAPIKIRAVAVATVDARLTMADLRDMVPPALIKAVPTLTITDAARLRANIRKMLPKPMPA